MTPTATVLITPTVVQSNLFTPWGGHAQSAEGKRGVPAADGSRRGGSIVGNAPTGARRSRRTRASAP